MEKMMERIKERIVEKDSPVKSLKALAEQIGMSEGGFYLMFKKGTMKLKTKVAICEALGVDESYFSGVSSKVEPDSSFGWDVIQSLKNEIHQTKQLFEDQLRVKDRQLEAKDSQIELLLGLLGKPEGVTVKPLSTYESFLDGLELYKALAMEQVVEPVKKSKNRGSKVGGTPFSYAENTVSIK